MAAKTLLALATVGLALAAFLPPASALADPLSLDMSAAGGDGSTRHTGWHDHAVPPNECPGGLVLAKALFAAAGRPLPERAGPGQARGSDLFIPAPCPTNPDCNALSGCGIHIDDPALAPADALLGQVRVACGTCTPAVGGPSTAAGVWLGTVALQA